MNWVHLIIRRLKHVVVLKPHFCYELTLMSHTIQWGGWTRLLVSKLPPFCRELGHWEHAVMHWGANIYADGLDLWRWGTVMVKSSQLLFIALLFKTLRPRQSGRHFAEDISNSFSWMGIVVFWPEFHRNLFRWIKLTALFQVMAWRRNRRQANTWPNSDRIRI